jgi:hypothetical protein
VVGELALMINIFYYCLVKFVTFEFVTMDNVCDFFCYNKQSQNLLIVVDGNPDYPNIFGVSRKEINILFLLAIFSDEVMDDLSKIATWLVQETKSNGQYPMLIL